MISHAFLPVDFLLENDVLPGQKDNIELKAFH